MKINSALPFLLQMPRQSPFTENILEKDRYILFYLIPYLKPRDLRNLAATCKTIEATYMTNSKYITKAIIKGIQGQATEPKPFKEPSFWDRQSVLTPLVHDLTGRLFNIINKEQAPSAPILYWLSRERMSWISDTRSLI